MLRQTLVNGCPFGMDCSLPGAINPSALLKERNSAPNDLSLTEKDSLLWEEAFWAALLSRKQKACELSGRSCSDFALKLFQLRRLPVLRMNGFARGRTGLDSSAPG